MQRKLPSALPSTIQLKGKNYMERLEGAEAGEHTETEMPNTQKGKIPNVWCSDYIPGYK